MTTVDHMGSMTRSEWMADKSNLGTAHVSADTADQHCFFLLVCVECVRPSVHPSVKLVNNVHGTRQYQSLFCRPAAGPCVGCHFKGRVSRNGEPTANINKK